MLAQISHSSNELWITVARDKKIFSEGRPWLSVKKHFLKHIYPNIESYQNKISTTQPEPKNESSAFKGGTEIKMTDECNAATISSNFELDVEFEDEEFIFENIGQYITTYLSIIQKYCIFLFYYLMFSISR